MNKGTMLLLGLITTLALTVTGGLDFIGGGKEHYSSGPAGIPHHRSSRQHRPHAPNDGHWHMKFHRGR